MTIYFYYTYFLLFGTCTYSKFMSIWINMGSIIILQFWFWDNWMLSAKSKVDNFLLLYVQKTKYMFLGLVIQSCPILCDPMNCSPLGSSVHGILQARMLDCVAIPFSIGHDVHVNILLRNQIILEFVIFTQSSWYCFLWDFSLFCLYH